MGKKTKLDKGTINDIIQEYKNSEISLEKLGKRYGVSPCTISSYLKKNGVEVINRQNMIYFDVVKDIIPLYEQGYSLTEISKIVGNSRQSIALKLKNYGFKYENRQNKTKFNENVFDVIDTEEKAYWLGFIYADGYISSTRFCFELSLKLGDIQHLENFNKFMGYQGDNVKIGKTSFGGQTFYKCRFSVTNKHLWEVLNNYGCVPRKSLILKFPDEKIFTDKKLIRHFLRGYFDGDGCLTYVSHKLKNGELNYSAISSVIGTYDFLTKYCIYFGVANPRICPLKNENKNTFVLFLSQSNTQKLIEFFYDDCTIFLERKYKRAMFFRHTCRSFKELEELLTGEIEEQTLIEGEDRDNLCDCE